MTEQEINEYVGEKVLNLRISHGLKQHHIATLLGLTRTSVVNIEAGRQGLTNLKLWLLASIFEIPISELFPPLGKFRMEETQEEVLIVKKIKSSKKFVQET